MVDAGHKDDRMPRQSGVYRLIRPELGHRPVALVAEDGEDHSTIIPATLDPFDFQDDTGDGVSKSKGRRVGVGPAIQQAPEVWGIEAVFLFW